MTLVTETSPTAVMSAVTQLLQRAEQAEDAKRQIEGSDHRDLERMTRNCVVNAEGADARILGDLRRVLATELFPDRRHELSDTGLAFLLKVAYLRIQDSPGRELSVHDFRLSA